MPRGDNPNSLKALEENRHKGSFDAETALIAKQKSDAKKLAKKTFKEQFEAELAAEINQRDKNGNVISKTTVKDAITKQVVQKALKGNTRAFELIRDTIGEKPVDTVQIVEPDFSELDALSYDK